MVYAYLVKGTKGTADKQVQDVLEEIQDVWLFLERGHVQPGSPSDAAKGTSKVPHSKPGSVPFSRKHASKWRDSFDSVVERWLKPLGGRVWRLPQLLHASPCYPINWYCCKTLA